jgi:hypothetical protein
MRDCRMIIIKSHKGKISLEFEIVYPFADFFEKVNSIKKYTNLHLTRTETNQIKNDGKLITSHRIYYTDLNEQIVIRIKEKSFSIDFSGFFTINKSLEIEKYRAIVGNDIEGIKINIITRSETEMYSVCIEGLKKFYLIESISQLSEREIKKILDGKSSLNFIEVRL